MGGSASKDGKYASYAENRIYNLGNNNQYAICWVDDVSNGRVAATNEYICTLAATSTNLSYKTSGWTGKVELRGRASDWGASSTWISGYVNFN